MCITLLKGDRRAVEVRLWKHWLTCAGHIAQRFDELEDDLFASNETASVSALAAAAAKAGMLSIAEYPVDKKDRKDRRRIVRGRADFWLQSKQRIWSIEFKQHMPEKRVPPLKKLEKFLEQSVGDARHLSNKEGETRVGALIVPTYWINEKDKKAETLRKRLHEFDNHSNVQFS